MSPTSEEAKAGQPEKFARIAETLQSTGVLDLSKALVEAMELKWGASYGDMMHFDMRNQGGDAAKIRAEIESFKDDRERQRKLHDAHVARTQSSAAKPDLDNHDDG